MGRGGEKGEEKRERRSIFEEGGREKGRMGERSKERRIPYGINNMHNSHQIMRYDLWMDKY